MPSNLISLLILIPLFAGLVNLALMNRKRLSRAVGVVSFSLTLALGLVYLLQIVGGDASSSSTVITTQMGNWQAPFGITIVFDALSGILVCSSLAVALAAYIHSFATLDPYTERRYYHPLMQLLISGVNMSFMTGDLFNLFVGFEIMLMASYGLMVIGTTAKQMKQAYKYILLNVLAGNLFLMGAGLVYGMTGTLNIAELAQMVYEAEAAQRAFEAGVIGEEGLQPLPPGFRAVAILLLTVFALKGAFFPLWYWLPDTYYTIPIAVAGLFGGLLTKVGVYTVIRLFPTLLASDGAGGTAPVIMWILAVGAGITMFFAVLGAVSQRTVRKILSVHIISQVGYMMFAIAIACWAARGVLGAGDDGAGPSVAAYAMAGAVFFVIHNMVVKCALFLCCGVMEMHAGTDDLDKLGGLLKRDVVLAVMFFIVAMSLVGLPPLSGFFGKMIIIQAGWTDLWWLSIVGLLTGALTLLSMLKIWSYGFWNPPKAPVVMPAKDVWRKGRPAYLGIGLLVVIALSMGFGAQAFYQPALIAGEQVMDRRPYIAAVLGEDATDQIDTLHALANEAQGLTPIHTEAEAAPMEPVQITSLTTVDQEAAP